MKLKRAVQVFFKVNNVKDLNKILDEIRAKVKIANKLSFTKSEIIELALEPLIKDFFKRGEESWLGKKLKVYLRSKEVFALKSKSAKYKKTDPILLYKNYIKSSENKEITEIR